MEPATGQSASAQARSHPARAPARPADRLDALTDEQAMRRVQQSGDEAAFALIFRRWRGRITRLCRRMTGDAHDAEDLAQEAFARLYARAGSFRHGAGLGTFLWRIALNACTDARRRTARRPSMEPPGPLADGNAPPDGVAAGRESAELVRRAVAELPDIYRSVGVLRHYEGLRFREVARVLDVPTGTVKSRMAEALNRLARALPGSLAPGGAPRSASRRKRT